MSSEKAQSRSKSPLSRNLRQKAKNIARLIVKYEELRYGDAQFRTSKGKEGKPPRIFVISTPANIFAEDSTEEVSTESNIDGTKNQNENKTENSEPKIAKNPLFKALNDLGELNLIESARANLDNRYNILQELGIIERLNCGILLKWARKLAKQITYILETREQYSMEIKAVFPELLNDLETARGTCDQLAHLLGKQSGILTNRQYTEMMSKLLHYAEVSQSAALQLADHHEEFITAEISPLEPGPEIDWVLEEEKPKPPLQKEEEKIKEE